MLHAALYKAAKSGSTDHTEAVRQPALQQTHGLARPVKSTLHKAPPSATLCTNTHGELRSPGSALPYSSPETLAQIHRGCTMGQKDTAMPQRWCVEKRPRPVKRNGTERNTHYSWA